MALRTGLRLARTEFDWVDCAATAERSGQSCSGNKIKVHSFCCSKLSILNVLNKANNLSAFKNCNIKKRKKEMALKKCWVYHGTLDNYWHYQSDVIRLRWHILTIWQTTPWLLKWKINFTDLDRTSQFWRFDYFDYFLAKCRSESKIWTRCVWRQVTR